MVLVLYVDVQKPIISRFKQWYIDVDLIKKRFMVFGESVARSPCKNCNSNWVWPVTVNAIRWRCFCFSCCCSIVLGSLSAIVNVCVCVCVCLEYAIGRQVPWWREPDWMRVREKRCTHIHILQSQTLFSGIKSDNNNNKVIRSSINNDANEMLHSDSNELCHPVCYMRYYGSKNMFDIEQHRNTHTRFSSVYLVGWAD